MHSVPAFDPSAAFVHRRAGKSWLADEWRSLSSISKYLPCQSAQAQEQQSLTAQLQPVQWQPVQQPLRAQQLQQLQRQQEP